MFAWSGLGAPSVGIDTDQERNPPPPPTPLDFPQYGLLKDQGFRPLTDFDAIYKSLLALRKPSDIDAECLKALNLQVVSDVDASQLVPDKCLDGLPPLIWEQAEGTQSHLMNNGVPYPPIEKYDIAKTELLLDNDDAYREVSRMPPKPGRTRVRLTQSRRFWAGLERMAQYWDDSQDEYYEKPATETESANQAHPEDKQLHNGTENGDTDKMDTRESPGESGSYERVYKGRRIGSGNEMPEDIREETMRGLLEMVAWPFQCQVAIPSLPPRLSVRKLLFPVRHTLVAGRVPQDRQAARRGILEGPLLAVQCRGDTVFRDADEPPGHGRKELCDLFREVGAMLLAAQERCRDGSVEVKPGEGKWWTTTPRWGGAPNEGVTGEAANSEKGGESEPGSGSVHKRSRYSNPLISSRRAARPRKLSASEKWNTLEPGPSLWDKKMKYVQIGKPKDSPYDDIFMLSHINHHVSILQLRVHQRYVECLANGTSECADDGSPEQPWNVLKLRRSKWYDLMDGEQRLELFNGVWRIFHYLMREIPESG